MRELAVSAPSRPRVVAGLRLVRLVGRGGEGEVWEARDERGRRRALKLVRPDVLADDAEARGRWLLRIDHPALVRVTRCGRLSGGPLGGWGFVEMDYVDGASLHDAAADADVLDRLRPLAEALDLLHAGAWSDGLPLVHRDVKPANLVRAPEGRLVLVDPSTLRGIDATQVTRVGTPVFCAPEVVTGRIGPAADVYSFAVTVLALVTGARGGRLADLVADVVGGWHHPGLVVPDGVRLALSPLPGDRPLSSQAVLESGRQVVAADVPAPPRWERVAGRQAAGQPSADVVAPGDAGWLTPVQPPVAPGGARPDRAGPAWPWLLLLVALVAGPTAAWSLELLNGPPLALSVAAAVSAHLVAHAAARPPDRGVADLGGRATAGEGAARTSGGMAGRVAAALAVPPVAWAFLLAERTAGPPRRRAWTRTVLTGVLCAGGAVLADALAGSAAVGGQQASLVLLTGAVVATAVAVRAPAVRGLLGLLVRVLLLPAWLAGAAVLLAGAVLALPIAPLLGGLRTPARLAGATLAGVVEVFRSPRRA